MSPNFFNNPSRQSFSVSFVAPLWLDRVHINAAGNWLNDSGDLGDKIDVRGPQDQNEIHLPWDFEAIRTAVLYHNTGKRPPVVASKQPASWTIQSGSSADQTLLIVGSDLWRNPQVFLDSMPATTVDLLPDMNGLVSAFQESRGSLQAVIGKLDGGDKLRRTNGGPEGYDSAGARRKTPAAPSATLAAGFVVAGDPTAPLTFAVNPDAMPSGFAGFVLNLRPTTIASEPAPVDTSGFSRSSDQKTLYFPIATAPVGFAFPSPVKVAADLRLKPNAFDDPINMLAQLDPSDRTVIYFPKQDQEKPILATAQPIIFDRNTRAYVSGNIVLNPNLPGNVTMQNLFDAYPGLEASIKNNTAMLVLQDPGTINPPPSCRSRRPRQQFHSGPTKSDAGKTSLW